MSNRQAGFCARGMLALWAISLAACFPSSDPNALLAIGNGGGPADMGEGSRAGGGNGNASGGQDGHYEPGSAGNAPTAGASPSTGSKCLPPRAEPLPQRSSILSVTVQPTEREVFVVDVYHQFKVLCQSCHVDQGLGGFRVSDKDYLGTLRNPEILKRITSDDLTRAMPVPATPYSQRAESDPVRNLAKLLNEWAAAKYPADLFLQQLPSNASISPYALSTELGEQFSNLGTCVPTPDFAFASDKESMAAQDRAFAARKPALKGEPADRIGLPAELSDTDLNSLDSEVLARRGVIAFAPAYPLWSDDAGKQRYVRVPLGKSIQFDRATQRFQIPENTRFYKTFLKKVTDAKGQPRWRKLETRLIVARADLTMTSDVNYVPQALFGSYKWDEAETHASLEIDQLRNNEPFRDDLFSYVEDEPAAAKIRAKKPANLQYEFEYNKVVRSWAIPGSKRCIHCHEGSSNGDFILGFTPLQLNRRPMGEGGVYEPAAADELTQLDRLIALKVVTGISAASEIVKLEDSQGDRKPRNDPELKAQAYLLANCAHCHNQSGFPSVANPELVNVLDLYPSHSGGVFQYSLETYSPRITRGYDSSKIAYITPSLRDIIPPLTQSIEESYSFKYGEIDPSSPNGLPFYNAPWRSLIYRNVQTAFTYSDYLTLYPHMPFDTAGHDCRAGQWLGEWMVSIPARRKHPELPENTSKPEGQDTDPQPYSEVLPGTDGYAQALVDANKRLAIYRNDPRYSLCPDNSDIVDKDVVSGRFPSPRDINGDGVPDHANWVVTDLTENPGLWTPRRSDWASILATDEPKFPPPGPSTAAEKKLEAERLVVEQLRSVHLSDLAGFADKKFPMALWKAKQGCKFDSVDRVSSPVFAGKARPAWFDKANAPADAPVYSVLPGQAIFDMICINCHGPNADSLGRQADTLQNLTGGAARVANFRYGLFNPAPLDDPYDKPDRGLQRNRARIFGSYADASVSIDDWGARYLSWMALGGTGVQIPSVILQQVARTDVAGTARLTPLVTQGDLTANMLQVAQAACASVLAEGRPFPLASERKPDRKSTPLIVTNGDAELWTTVCGLHNAPRVYKIALDGEKWDGSGATVEGRFFPATPCDSSGLPAGCYPADAPIGNERGSIVRGLRADNQFAWCIDPAPPLSEPLDAAKLQAFVTQFAVDGTPLPICPSSWQTQDDLEARSRWITRGAINAGLTVYGYLKTFIESGAPHVAYDQCDKLQ